MTTTTEKKKWHEELKALGYGYKDRDLIVRYFTSTSPMNSDRTHFGYADANLNLCTDNDNMNAERAVFFDGQWLQDLSYSLARAKVVEKYI